MSAPAAPTPLQSSSPLTQTGSFSTPANPPKNGTGVAALVLGILGILPLIFPIIMSVLAIIFGAVGRSKVTRGEATNKGVATAGLILGIIGTTLNFLFLLASV